MICHYVPGERFRITMRRDRLIVLAALALLPRSATCQGNPVGPEFRVNTYTTDDQEFPDVASDAAGNFVVVWKSPHDSAVGLSGVFGQRYAVAGTPLGSEFLVNTYTTQIQGLPSVAADASGNFVVVWRSLTQDGSSFGVFGQRYASSGAPLGPEFRVNTYTSGGQYDPSVASDPSGNFVVVWSSYPQEGSNHGVFAQRFAASGVPLGPEFRVNSYTTDGQSGASTAMDSGGNFVVVWFSALQDGSDSGIFGQRYASSGAPLGAEFRVNTYTTGAQQWASLASDPSGNFVVVWYGAAQDGSQGGVFGQRYTSSGAPLGPEFRVNANTTGDQFVPSVRTDAAGNFVVAWQSAAEYGTSWGIFGQRFESSGAPLGPEFRVNTYTSYVQRSPAVGADALGNFVVVWVSETQDGPGFGIFAQRFNQMVPVEIMAFEVE